MKRFLISLVLLLFISNAYAADHYVLDGGSGDGSAWDNAWDDLPATLTRGDTYYIGDGVYATWVIDDAVSTTDIITIKKSTVADHGTETGYVSTDHDGIADIGHNGGTAYANNNIHLDTSYIDIDGQFSTDGVAGTYGFRLLKRPGATVNEENKIFCEGSNYNISYIEAQAMDAVDAAQRGILSAMVVGQVSNSVVSHFLLDRASNGIVLGGANNVILEYLWFRNHYYNAIGVHAQWINLKPAGTCPGTENTNIVLRWSTFEDTAGGQGIVSFNDRCGAVDLNISVDGMDIYGNVADLSLDSFVDSTTKGGMVNVNVYNNSLTGDGTNDWWLGDAGSAPGSGVGLEARNNLLYNMDAEIGTVDWDSDYNRYLDTSDTPTEANSTTGTGDPYLDTATFDFHLLAATPAGEDIGSPYDVDPDGVTRGVDGVWDIGAYEYSGEYDSTVTITGGYIH